VADHDPPKETHEQEQFQEEGHAGRAPKWRLEPILSKPGGRWQRPLVGQGVYDRNEARVECRNAFPRGIEHFWTDDGIHGAFLCG
jgi:hypothetical protein